MAAVDPDDEAGSQEPVLLVSIQRSVWHSGRKLAQSRLDSS